jgi:hypothetical protein
MKRLLCLLLGVLCGVPAWAQDASLPGCELITNFLPLTQITGGGAQPMLCPETTPITQTSGAIAEAITPDITALAEALGYDPTNIFNFVHDQIRYIHYYGSKKGAELTLLERSGNDFDQCALLSALLQASGFPTTYGLAIMGIPYDTNTCLDLHHWLGLDFYNTNWYSTTNYFAYFTGTRGDPVCVPFSDSNTIGLQRIWVNVTIGGVTYYLDPAFKISRPTNGINLSSAMGLSTSNLWAAAGGTDSGYSVTGLNEGALRTALKSCSSNLLAYISNSAPGASVASIVGGQQIVSSVGSPLMTSLVYPTYTSSAYPLLIWTNQPTNFMGTFSIAIGGTKSSWPTPALAGQRLSLTFSNNGVAQLWLEDSNILSTTNLGGSNTTQVIFTATHPYGGWSNSAPMDSGWCDRSSTNTYQTTNAIYTIMYGFEPNAVWLKERQQRLDAYLAAGYTNGSRQLTCETLNVMGLGWMVQAELAHELSSQEWNQLPEFQHRFGRMGQESGRGYYVDLYLQMDGTMPSTGFNTPDVNAMYEEYDVNSFFASAMEHGIIEQLQNSNLVAASTVKMLEIASTNSQPIYMASSSDWTTGPNVRSSLVNYGSTLSVLDTLISNGFILLLPRNGSNQVAGSNTWTGDAYVQLGVTTAGRSMGMMIGAGYYGGYVSDGNSTVNAPYISQISDSQPTYFNVVTANGG